MDYGWNLGACKQDDFLLHIGPPCTRLPSTHCDTRVVMHWPCVLEWQHWNTLQQHSGYTSSLCPVVLKATIQDNIKTKKCDGRKIPIVPSNLSIFAFFLVLTKKLIHAVGPSLLQGLIACLRGSLKPYFLPFLATALISSALWPLITFFLKLDALL